MFDVDDDLMDTSEPGRHHHGNFRSHPFASPQANRKMSQKQDPPIEYDLAVSLEDILKGADKKIKISRAVIGLDGTRRKEDKVLTIHVKPGWKAGTKITFPREGDQNPNSIPADVVFVIRDKPHSTFKRDGSDIKYTVKITLRQVINHFLLNNILNAYIIIFKIINFTFFLLFFKGSMWLFHNCSHFNWHKSHA